MLRQIQTRASYACDERKFDNTPPDAVVGGWSAHCLRPRRCLEREDDAPSKPRPTSPLDNKKFLLRITLNLLPRIMGDTLLTYSSDFGAARLDPCELRSRTISYTLSERSATQRCRRSGGCWVLFSLRNFLIRWPRSNPAIKAMQ
ncbi:hypothetical protein EVAR_24710_1 [Eumeta japonica]|uniref:Uncharacterized protein n=1 Tax=Eumeta variegata TaxID=151549 RepID=A0A4C1VC39_EUMVA|nr:hypothetical protein EVAR_24710_1 [Eumeta japonica]